VIDRDGVRVKVLDVRCPSCDWSLGNVNEWMAPPENWDRTATIATVKRAICYRCRTHLLWSTEPLEGK